MSTEAITDAQVVGTEIVPAAGGGTAAQMIFKTDDPMEIMQRTAEVAVALKEFVKSQGLTSVISGRDYLLVEAWQMLGMMLGVTPGKVCTQPVENGWESVVELHDRNGRVVGAGEAECLATEKTWKSREDYARKSMAQTRAVGKAFRNTFGFIAKAAGYEATPAEEMPNQDQTEQGPTFGPAAADALVAQGRRALGYLLDLQNPDDARIIEVLHWISGEAGGYLPSSVMRGIVLAATQAKKTRPEPATPEQEEQAQEAIDEFASEFIDPVGADHGG
jgi:hypothetical protein